MKYFLLLTLFFIAAYLLPLGCRTSAVPDEFRYAEIPREMIASGDWTTPRLLGLRYFEKPVLGYWLTAASFKCFGYNRFANRLPAAIATGLTALLIALLIRQTLREEKLAALAAAIYLAFGFVYGIGTFAVLDAQVTFFITGTLGCLFLAALESAFSRRKAALLIIAGIFAGLAFLTKGFIAFAVPGIAAVVFLIWDKRFKEFLVMPPLVLLGCVTVVLPWALAIHRAEPDFWRYFVVVEHIQRFVNGGNGQHPEPFWFLLGPLLGGAFPALLLGFSTVTLKGRWRELFRQPLYRFALGATVGPFIFFSLSSGKLATYILPCFPPLAVLLAGAVASYFRSGGRNLVFKHTMTVYAAILAAAGVLALSSALAISYYPVPFLQFVPADLAPQLPRLLIACGFAVLIAGTLLLVTVKRLWRLRLYLFFAGIGLIMMTSGLFVPRIDNSKFPAAILKKLPARLGFDPKTAVIVTLPGLSPAVALVYERENLLLASPGELEYGLAAAAGENRPTRLIDGRELAKLFATSDRPVLYIHRSPDDPMPYTTVPHRLKRFVNNDITVDYTLPVTGSRQP